ncbi:hypothetical protein OGAPHI_004779 [Ogataea philodendri]|uniref:Flavoprotein domain-containing protein n=1 Tax=Ogataea philodendri TaxID=1378263 RepID=A0A9P8P2H2_9ASCO|nr:uncharacterized protein OGAPHI_004779 [Ogataea philodendri]KAH3664065.1 hypothetical protein OGAPHI_004779 [Ogataea philodendri]
MSLSEKSINTVRSNSKGPTFSDQEKVPPPKSNVPHKSTQQPLPRPILFKTGSSASNLGPKQPNLPSLKTTLDSDQKGDHTVVQATSAAADPDLSTPLGSNQGSTVFPSEASTPIKSSGSISFQVPPVNAQKHRGSISARPSTTKLTLLETTTSGVPSSRQPSGNHPASQNIHDLPQQVKHLDIQSARTTPTTTAPHFPVVVKEPREHSVSSVLSDKHHSNLPSPRVMSSSSGVVSPVSFDLSPKTLPNVNSEATKNDFVFQPLSGDSRVPSPQPIKRRTTTTPKTVVSAPTGPVVPFTEYLSKEDDDKIHILLGATGSVATVKIPMIIDKLFKLYGVDNVSIQLVVTQAAEHFLHGLKISTEVKIWRENEEWSTPMTKPGDPILHVELRKWADIFLIAPLSANTLAKVANGIADNLLTSIIRVWNPSIPVLVAPAMNTLMYTHPVTKKHLAVIKEDFKYMEVLRPIEKVLVCGDIGMGGMREWSEIVDILFRKMSKLHAEKLKKANEREDEEEDEEEEDEDDDDDDEEYDDDDDDDDDDDESLVVDGQH